MNKHESAPENDIAGKMNQGEVIRVFKRNKLFPTAVEKRACTLNAPSGAHGNQALSADSFPLIIFFSPLVQFFKKTAVNHFGMSCVLCCHCHTPMAVLSIDNLLAAHGIFPPALPSLVLACVLVLVHEHIVFTDLASYGGYSL